MVEPNHHLNRTASRRWPRVGSCHCTNTVPRRHRRFETRCFPRSWCEHCCCPWGAGSSDSRRDDLQRARRRRRRAGAHLLGLGGVGQPLGQLLGQPALHEGQQPPGTAHPRGAQQAAHPATAHPELEALVVGRGPSRLPRGPGIGGGKRVIGAASPGGTRPVACLRTGRHGQSSLHCPLANHGWTGQHDANNAAITRKAPICAVVLAVDHRFATGVVYYGSERTDALSAVSCDQHHKITLLKDTNFYFN